MRERLIRATTALYPDVEGDELKFYMHCESIPLYSTLLYSTLLYSTLPYSTLLYFTLLYTILLLFLA